jgi:RNase P/RNase MRP subunit p29
MIEKTGLIGKKTTAEYANILFEGIIIDETKNTVDLETSNGIKKLIKKNAIFKISGQKLNGKYITKRPEDRIKG